MVVVHTSYIVTTVCRIEVVVGMQLRKQESARRVRKKKNYPHCETIFNQNTYGVGDV